MPCVITASESSWIASITGLSPRVYAKLMRHLRRQDEDVPSRGRP
ncbi:hypothetical protein [Streptomyces collinus]